MATVLIQYQETRKPYRWVNAFRARVLFADRKTVLVRGAGSESLFRGDGSMNLAGYKPNQNIKLGPQGFTER